ncbi:hypothetical protein T12_2986 [Trichinella patagoniensis]|uniref:Uncharacterized protein n=1 Tax=Trichinella patagoniensis TaxID=990121 RepID=A0A0V1AEJ9_9BILA|nr:hypothetical protein T12_2986 [Trichinella patagoniensis]
MLPSVVQRAAISGGLVHHSNRATNTVVMGRRAGVDRRFLRAVISPVWLPPALLPFLQGSRSPDNIVA